MSIDIARFENGKIIIEISADLLAHAQENADWNWDGDRHLLKVTDKNAFAKAVAAELNREDGDTGLSDLHRLLDEAAQRAVESACDGAEYGEQS